MGLMIDSHTHSWSSECSLVEGRRYTPTQAHPITMLFEKMQSADIGKAVLVQPSFLGTNNHYLLQELEHHPKKLRGVVVVDNEIPENEFEQMVSKGVVGVRLNIIGSKITGEDLVKKHEKLIHLLKKFKCHLEIQTEHDHWQTLLPALIKAELSIVIDHFGRPRDESCLGFKSILQNLDTGLIWVKLSGWYRFNVNPVVLAKQLLERAPERIVWGSDYPWTQHSKGKNYLSCQQKINEWCESKHLDKILVRNPEELFKFNS